MAISSTSCTAPNHLDLVNEALEPTALNSHPDDTGLDSGEKSLSKDEYKKALTAISTLLKTVNPGEDFGEDFCPKRPNVEDIKTANDPCVPVNNELGERAALSIGEVLLSKVPSESQLLPVQVIDELRRTGKSLCLVINRPAAGPSLYDIQIHLFAAKEFDYRSIEWTAPSPSPKWTGPHLLLQSSHSSSPPHLTLKGEPVESFELNWRVSSRTDTLGVYLSYQDNPSGDRSQGGTYRVGDFSYTPSSAGNPTPVIDYEAARTLIVRETSALKQFGLPNDTTELPNQRRFQETLPTGSVEGLCFL